MSRIALILIGLSLPEMRRSGRRDSARRCADAISRGLDTSHRIAEVKAREEGAQAAVKGAEVAKRPIVSASAATSAPITSTSFRFRSRTARSSSPIPTSRTTSSAALAFQWPIYTSGRTDALERAAEAEASAVGAEIETARADLRFEIVRAYWAAVTAREAVRVLEESAARADAQLADARQRFKVGLIPPNEVSSLEAQRSREQAQFFEAGNIRESALIELRRLIGVPYDTVIDLVDPLDQGAQGAQSARGAAACSGTDQERARVATGTEGPVVPARRPGGATAGRVDGQQTDHQPGRRRRLRQPEPPHLSSQGEWQESWDIGVNVNWNFLDFGRTKAQAAEASAAVLATRERLAEFDTVVAADVRQRLLDVQTAHAMVNAARDARPECGRGPARGGRSIRRRRGHEHRRARRAGGAARSRAR